MVQEPLPVMASPAPTRLLTKERSAPTDDFPPLDDAARAEDLARGGGDSARADADGAGAGTPSRAFRSSAQRQAHRLPRPHRALDAARLCRRILETVSQSRASNALLIRAQSGLVEMLHSGERFQRLGFASLRDAGCELVGLEARTLRERRTLQRIFAACPAAEQAFLEGRLSLCQVLVLGRVLRTRGVDVQAWIEQARSMTVRALREHVRAWSREQPHETEREGSEVGFEMPATLTLAWEQGLEQARRALGESAPVWRCLEAALAETGLAGSGEEEQDAEASRAGDRGELPEAPGMETVPEPMRIPVPSALARRVDADLAAFAQHQQDIGQLLDAASPRDAFDALARLQAIERLRAPSKILLARLVRDLRDLRAAQALGYPTLADLLITELSLAERTARRLLETATALEDAPILEREVGEGRLSLGKALLARRLGGGGRLPLTIARARAITHRAFEQEMRFLWLLRRCAPKLWARFPGPLPMPGLEQALMEEIALWSRRPLRGGGAPGTGRSRSETETIEPVTAGDLAQELDRRFEALEPHASLDPAENPVVLKRLEALLEKLVLLVWEDGEPLERPMSARLGRTVRVRFWAPTPVAADFRAAIRQIQRAGLRQEASITNRAGPEGPLDPPAGPPGARLRSLGLPSPPRMAPWQAALLLLGWAARIWSRQEDPRARRTLRARILARDRARCVAPGCTRRRMLELHHALFRSRGGGDAETNLMSLCHGHHQHVLHRGYARPSGRAPQSLAWELGCRPHRPPLLATRGERTNVD